MAKLADIDRTEKREETVDLGAEDLADFGFGLLHGQLVG